MSQEAAILRANREFYDAFRNTDLDKLNRIWAKEFPVSCMHPVAPLVSGYEAVIESWRLVFQGMFNPEIECTDEVVRQVGTLAFVTCTTTMAHSRFAVTNIFVTENSEWRMVHHQAGALPSVTLNYRGSQAIN